MSVKLNDRQTEIAVAIREVAQTPSGDSWGDFSDFIRATSAMIEGAECLLDNNVMSERFQTAWEAFSKLLIKERSRIIRDCLGGQEELDRIKEHPNGRNIIGKIWDRVEQTHKLMPDMIVKDVDVDDIILDELES